MKYPATPGRVLVYKPSTDDAAAPVHIVTDESALRYRYELTRLGPAVARGRTSTVGFTSWNATTQTVTSTLTTWCDLDFGARITATGIEVGIPVVPEVASHKATCPECLTNYRNSHRYRR